MGLIMATMVSTPLNNCEQVVGKIAELQIALQQALPGYESMLHQIHVALQKDEDCTVLLTPEQIGVIVAGLSKKKGIVLATSKTASGAKKTASGKALKDVSLGDFGG